MSELTHKVGEATLEISEASLVPGEEDDDANNTHNGENGAGENEADDMVCVTDSQEETLVSQKLQVPFPMERAQHKGAVVVSRNSAKKLTTLSLLKASKTTSARMNRNQMAMLKKRYVSKTGGKSDDGNKSDDEGRLREYDEEEDEEDEEEDDFERAKNRVKERLYDSKVTRTLSALASTTTIVSEDSYAEDNEQEEDVVVETKDKKKKRKKKKRPSVLLLYTGGTIGMRKDAATGAYFPDAEYLADRLVHGLLPRDAAMPDLSLSAYTPPLDSSDMNSIHWTAIAEAIGEEYDKYDGFVVISGTDTMAYTASALSFALENLGKPVVVTGSQIPISVVRSDGVTNLVDSCLVAAHGGKDLPEVVIVFDGLVMRANRTTKLKAWGISAFKSFSYPVLGEGGVRLVTFPNRSLHLSNPPSPFRCVPHFSSEVALFSVYPGVEQYASDVLKTLLAKKVRGIVLEAFGTGNTPSQKSFMSTLDELCHIHNVVVCVVSRCPHGAVSLGTYSGGYCLAQAGCTSCHDMTVEAAFTKLCWLLGDPSLSVDRVRELMETDLRGEVTQGLFIHSDGNHQVLV